MTEEYYTSLGGTKIPKSRFNPAHNQLLYDPGVGKHGVYVDEGTIPKGFAIPGEIAGYPVIPVTSAMYLDIEESIPRRWRFYPTPWKDIKMKSIIARIDKWGCEG